ncbi:MAG: glycosyltransferase [Pseudomonadota bacterium]
MKILVVLPAYNEEESLPNLLSRFETTAEQTGTEFQIFVVNDGSTDKTKELVLSRESALSINLLDHEVNRGLGQAVQTGLRKVAEIGGSDDIVVLMDADDTHNPETAIQLAKSIQSGADISIASRFVNGGDDRTAPPFRRLLSRGAALIFKTLLPVDSVVNDFTSGFRGYRVSVLQRAIGHWGERLIEENGFACMVELLLKLRHTNPAIVEVPLKLQYDRKLGVSKIRILSTIFQYLKLAIRDKVSPPPFRVL